MHLLPRRAAVQRANDALWLVGLGEERFRPVGTMSTGQRQRVKLAAAIAHDPELVLLDEPTDGLDPMQRTEMLALIRRIGTEFGMHIVVSSHHLEEVETDLRRGRDRRGRRGRARGHARGRAPAARPGSWSRWTRGRTSWRAALAAAASPSTAEDALLLLGGEEGVHDAVRDAVADLGVGLRRLGPRGRTLEDVYLEAGA